MSVSLLPQNLKKSESGKYKRIKNVVQYESYPKVSKKTWSVYLTKYILLYVIIDKFRTYEMKKRHFYNPK